jgi:hypothetical protein
MKTKSFVVAVTFALLASITRTTANGPTNVVNSPDEASLRAAIQIGGWVGLGFNGTITITNTIAISNNVILDGSGGAASISGGNAVRLFYVAPGVTFGATNLTLANGSCIFTNGTTADAGAIYNDGGTVALTACTLTNNSAQSLVFSDNYWMSTLARGGAIFNNGGVVLLNQSSISNNAVIGGGSGTAEGGALYNANGAMTITGCNVSSNICLGLSGGFGTGQAMGGAAFQASGSLTISNSVFAFNQAIGGTYTTGFASPACPGYGGVLAAAGGSVMIDHSQFYSNIARGGDSGPTYGTAGPAAGGAVYSTSALTVSDSSFFGNQSLAGNDIYAPRGGANGTAGFGGAIYNSGTAMLNRCSVYSNSVQGGTGISYMFTLYQGGDALGGGIFNASQLAATNCTIALNSASGGAGGVLNYRDHGPGGNAIGGGVFNNTDATFTAMNLTIANNVCSSPPGYSQGPSYGTVAGAGIANTGGTLRLHNSLIAYGGAGNAYGPITDDGNNMSSDGTAGLSSASSYNNTDPQLTSLANYGGPTWCMTLLSTSPAIDSGDPSDFPATDQRGYARPFGAGPDMGAYEYGSTQTVTSIPHLTLATIPGNLLLSFTANPPNAYRLQTSTNLTTWTDLTTNGPFASATNISQTISPQGFNRRFFRLLVQ